MDGLVWSDHTENPGLIEYKKAIELVIVRLIASKLEIRNHYDFINLDYLSVSWYIAKGSGNTDPTDWSLPDIKPGESLLIEPPVSLSNAEKEAWLTISFQLKNAERWAPQGHEVAFSQIPLPFARRPALVRPLEVPTPFNLQEARGKLFITAPSFDSLFCFDLVRGTLAWSTTSGCILRHGPELGIYRALTQNDKGSRGDGAEWKRFYLPSAKMHVQGVSWERQDDGSIKIVTSVRIAPPILEWGCKATMTYTITPSSVQIYAIGDFVGEHPKFLPRIGLTMALPSDFNEATWFGRGLGESYRDKKEAARFGLWSASLDEL